MITEFTRAWRHGPEPCGPLTWAVVYFTLYRVPGGWQQGGAPPPFLAQSVPYTIAVRQQGSAGQRVPVDSKLCFFLSTDPSPGRSRSPCVGLVDRRCLLGTSLPHYPASRPEKIGRALFFFFCPVLQRGIVRCARVVSGRGTARETAKEAESGRIDTPPTADALRKLSSCRTLPQLLPPPSPPKEGLPQKKFPKPLNTDSYRVLPADARLFCPLKPPFPRGQSSFTLLSHTHRYTYPYPYHIRPGLP